MKQVFDKGTKIQVVKTEEGNWYKVGEIYTVHSYLEHKNAYVVEEGYIVYKDSAWIDAKDVEMYIDWSKAPKGYDFWIVDNEDTIPPTFHKYVENHGTQGACYVDINGSYWTATCDHITAYKRTVAEKKEMNAFNKDGLPNIGTEFEYSLGNGYWFKATCTYVVGDSGVVAMCETMESVVEQYLDVEDCEFRPIKSKEQQEREEAIDEMLATLRTLGYGYNLDYATTYCEKLYGAGWRKVE